MWWGLVLGSPWWWGGAGHGWETGQILATTPQIDSPPSHKPPHTLGSMGAKVGTAWEGVVEVGWGLTGGRDKADQLLTPQIDPPPSPQAPNTHGGMWAHLWGCHHLLIHIPPQGSWSVALQRQLAVGGLWQLAQLDTVAPRCSSSGWHATAKAVGMQLACSNQGSWQLVVGQLVHCCQGSWSVAGLGSWSVAHTFKSNI